MRAEPQAPEAFSQFGRETKGQISAFLTDVAERVQWPGDFADMKADEFVFMKRLVALDLWFSYSPEEIALRLGVEPYELDPYRQSAYYDDMRAALSEAFETAQVARDFEGELGEKEMQQLAFRTLKRLLKDPDGRVAERALQQVVDRYMPVKRERPELVGSVVLLTTEQAQIMEAACREVGRPLELGPGLEPADE